MLGDSALSQLTESLPPVLNDNWDGAIATAGRVPGEAKELQAIPIGSAYTCKIATCFYLKELSTKITRLSEANEFFLDLSQAAEFRER